MPEFDPPIGNVRLTNVPRLLRADADGGRLRPGGDVLRAELEWTGSKSEGCCPVRVTRAVGVTGWRSPAVRASDDLEPESWALEGANYPVYNQSFSRLVWKDAEGKESGDLAESWVIAPDGLSSS